MRLKSITIEGFRAFGGQATLDLDADVIVLQGPNGVGKTSLLDAILWALAGRISRFQDRGSPVSLYAREGRARVELTLTGSDGDVTVIRAFDGDKLSVRLRTAGEELEGASADQRLCDMMLPHLKERAEAQQALGRVLTRGVYLQQDLVRQFVDGDSAADRFALVSEVIGAGVVLEVQQSLEKSRNAWSRATNAFRKEEVEPIKSRINQIDEYLGRLAQDGIIEDAGARVASEVLYSNAVELLGKNRLASEEAPSTPGRLDRFLKELAAERSRVEREITTLQSLIEQGGEFRDTANEDSKLRALHVEESDISADLLQSDDAIRKEIDRIAAERQRQLAAEDRVNRAAAMAKLALVDLDDCCPVCQQRHDIEHTIRHLQALIDSASEPVPKIEEVDKLAGLNQNRTILFQRLERVRTERADLNRVQAERVARMELFHSRLHDLGIEPLEDAAGQLAVRLRAARLTSEELDSMIAEGERLSLSVLRLGEQRRREELRVERGTLAGRLAEAVARADSQDRTHTAAGQLIEALRGAVLTVTQRQIEQIAPLFQRIYSRIDPHPTFRVTQILTAMERGKGQLNIGISDPESEGIYNASPLLSSSQLNSYAVSLFLAMNLAIPTLKLGVTILDDPLQSLDSINLLGLVDVLRRFRRHRQIIVSTHEERLMGLLQRKLRPICDGERTITMIFEDWSREGPSFRTDCASFSTEQDRVLAA